MQELKRQCKAMKQCYELNLQCTVQLPGMNIGTPNLGRIMCHVQIMAYWCNKSIPKKFWWRQVCINLFNLKRYT